MEPLSYKNSEMTVLVMLLYYTKIIMWEVDDWNVFQVFVVNIMQKQKFYVQLRMVQKLFKAQFKWPDAKVNWNVYSAVMQNNWGMGNGVRPTFITYVFATSASIQNRSSSR